MKLLLACLLAVPFLSVGWADAGDPYKMVLKAQEKASHQLCHSTPEYIKTLKFLRSTKEFGFQEKVSRSVADEVSRGCDGAAKRFSQVILLLKSVGLSERGSLKMALEFSQAGPEVQQNFIEIFTHAYLSEFLNYEYARAMKIALSLSKNYKGDPSVARADFIALVQFCKDSSKLDLPAALCADYAEKVAELSQYYADGVSRPFIDLYGQLRNRKDLELNVKDALNIAYDILQHGPTAADNFMQAYDFAQKDLAFDRKASLAFAVKLASRSHLGETPPVMQFVPPENSELPAGAASSQP